MQGIQTLELGPGKRSKPAGVHFEQWGNQRAGHQILEQSGGGIWCPYIDATVSNCIISGNIAPWMGGGAYSGTLNNCLVMGNSATNTGGGVCSNLLINCTIASNRVMYGAGGAAGAILRNSIIYFNSGFSGPNHASSFFNSCCTTPAPVGGVNNSIVYFNTAPSDPNYLKNSSYALNYSCTLPLPPDGGGNKPAAVP